MISTTHRPATEPAHSNDGLNSPRARVRESASSDIGQWSLSSNERRDDPNSLVEISEFPFRVGRNPENHLRINNRIVSGKHAELFIINNDLCIRDLNSTNGTFLNGERVNTFEKVCDGDIIHFGRSMYRIFEEGDDAPDSLGTLAESYVANDAECEAVAHVMFNQMMNERAIYAHYQPIIQLDDGSNCGYEVLCRSRVQGLEMPGKMFRLAEEQRREEELSQLVRLCGVQQAVAGRLNEHLYVNTHPVELKSGNLHESLDQLRRTFPDIRMTLEVHEAAVTSMKDLFELRRHAQDLQIGLAYDDFGAGQSRLLEIIEVPPDVLKFDMKLVHDLPRSQHTRDIMKALIRIVKDLGVIPLVEGVESAEQSDICRELGAEYGQGYFYGRPQPLAEITSA